LGLEGHKVRPLLSKALPLKGEAFYSVDFVSIFDYNANMDTKFAINNKGTQAPISYDFLKEQFKEYRSPKDKISRLVKEGKLIRLKKGLFLPSSDKNSDIFSLGAAANSLYGPSYVSLHTALSYYGMIPERVYSIRSMTTKRGKTFKTSVGWFDYSTAGKEYFPIGIRSVNYDEVSFLIASPEKAICDMIMVTSGLRIQSAKAMRKFIEDDMRIELPDDEPVEFSVIDRVLETGIKRREMQLLREYIENARYFI